MLIIKREAPEQLAELNKNQTEQKHGTKVYIYIETYRGKCNS